MDWNLSVSASISTSDGQVGRLKYVVVDPEDYWVTDIIIEPNPLFPRHSVVPVGWILRADEHNVLLNANRLELESLPEFREDEFRTPDPSSFPLLGYPPDKVRIWVSPYFGIENPGKPAVLALVRLGIEPGEVLIRRGYPVLDDDAKPVGSIDHVLVELASLQLSDVVVHRGPWLTDSPEVIMPAAWIVGIGDSGIRLQGPTAEIDRLPRYRPPAADSELAARVTRALETQPETSGRGLHVHVQRGLVRLFGPISDNEAAASAVILAQMTRGVVGVEDQTTHSDQADLRIGAPVFAVDGHVGSLDKMIVDPRTNRVTHLVVRHGSLLAEDRVVPIELVELATDEGIDLRVTSQELKREPRYVEHEVANWPATLSPPRGYSQDDVRVWAPPLPGTPPFVPPLVEQVHRHGAPEDEIVLDRGTEVHAGGEVVGEVDHVILNPTREKITHLVIDLFDSPHPVIVPIDWVEEIGDGYVNLKRTRQELQDLPPYTRQDDDEIAGAVQSALQHAGAETFHGLDLHVDRGLVRLGGTTPTHADKVEAERIARTIPGVVGVKNELLPDTDLMARVIDALTHDPHTGQVPIEVSSVNGIVTLRGEVESASVKAAAEQIARQVPGVELVIDELTVRPHESKVDDIAPASQNVSIRRE